jgi:hypothetical protein
MLPSQFVEFYRKQEIKILILRNLVRQVWLLIFYSNTKLLTMNYSYYLRIFLCCLWSIIFEGSKFEFRKIVSGPRVSIRSLHKKKTTVACPTDKGDPGKLTIVANKCSIVRNAPCRMNMHPPRRPDPCPLPLPRSELHRRHPPIFPRRRTHVALHRFVWRCTCEEQGPRLPEQPQ